MGLVNIHPSARIARSVRIDVTERLIIGPGAFIGECCEISGRDIEIGAEFFMERGARIGGGSCFERQSSLRIGHFAHLGWDVFINTARPVTLGNEVGLGTRSAIYTHGAYLSALEGFPVAFAPVTIGDRVWLPGATVNPGVTIGSDVVIGVGSVVTRNIPSGSLAAGSPAVVLKAEYYPKLDRTKLAAFWSQFWTDFGREYPTTDEEIVVGETRFSLKDRLIYGPATSDSERVRNQLRRNGIRFYSWKDGGEYTPI